MPSKNYAIMTGFQLYFFFRTGYDDNKDWYIPPPSQRAAVTGTDLLTPEQTQETLNYFCKLHKPFYLVALRRAVLSITRFCFFPFIFSYYFL